MAPCISCIQIGDMNHKNETRNLTPNHDIRSIQINSAEKYDHFIILNIIQPEINIYLTIINLPNKHKKND